jgi:hypothetical protein
MLRSNRWVRDLARGCNWQSHSANLHDTCELTAPDKAVQQLMGLQVSWKVMCMVACATRPVIFRQRHIMSVAMVIVKTGLITQRLATQ